MYTTDRTRLRHGGKRDVASMPVLAVTPRNILRNKLHLEARVDLLSPAIVTQTAEDDGNGLTMHVHVTGVHEHLGGRW